jgi:putative copper export protein
VDTTPLIDAAAPVRWIAFLSLLPMGGAMMVRMLAMRALGSDHPAIAARITERARVAGLVATMILLSALAFKLYLQVRSLADPGESLTWASAQPVLELTRWGRGWEWQFASGIGATAAFFLARRRAGWLAVVLTVLVSLWSSTLTGHAVEHPWGPRVGVMLQGLHVAGGAVWLGTLAVLLATMMPETRGHPEHEILVARLVHAYSPVALAGAATLALAGVLLSIGYVGSFGALAASAYGRTLLVKLALLGGILCLGYHNWRRLRPVLGAPPGARRLRRSASAELALGTALLAVTAVRVALPAPGLP